MNDPLNNFISNIAKMRQAVIKSGGRPNTLKISQQAIEKCKLFGMDIEVVSSVVLPDGVDCMVFEDSDRNIHIHNWLIVRSDVRYRDEYANEFIIDFYRCECGAGGRVKTPKAEYDKGNKVLGITEDKENTI